MSDNFIYVNKELFLGFSYKSLKMRPLVMYFLMEYN